MEATSLSTTAVWSLSVSKNNQKDSRSTNENRNKKYSEEEAWAQGWKEWTQFPYFVDQAVKETEWSCRRIHWIQVSRVTSHYRMISILNTFCNLFTWIKWGRFVINWLDGFQSSRFVITFLLPWLIEWSELQASSSNYVHLIQYEALQYWYTRGPFCPQHIISFRRPEMHPNAEYVQAMNCKLFTELPTSLSMAISKVVLKTASRVTELARSTLDHGVLLSMREKTSQDSIV